MNEDSYIGMENEGMNAFEYEQEFGFDFDEIEFDEE
jgi:hypothetical protein